MPGYKASISGSMLRLSRNHNRDDDNRTRTPIRPVSMLLLAMIGSAGLSWPADGAGILLVMRLSARDAATGRPEEALLSLGLDPLAARIHRKHIHLKS